MTACVCLCKACSALLLAECVNREAAAGSLSLGQILGPWVHWDGLQQLVRRNFLLTPLNNKKISIFKTRHILFLSFFGPFEPRNKRKFTYGRDHNCLIPILCISHWTISNFQATVSTFFSKETYNNIRIFLH